MTVEAKSDLRSISIIPRDELKWNNKLNLLEIGREKMKICQQLTIFLSWTANQTKGFLQLIDETSDDLR